MADDDTSLFGRARKQLAKLAPTQDNNPSPQSRDEDPSSVAGREEYREEIDENEITKFKREYQRNPLIRVPVQNFAADVTEPGVSVEVDLPQDIEEIPEVPESSGYPEYTGMPLDDALESWLSECYIDGWSYHGSFAALLENVVKDRRGRRGTSVIEHVYDDPRERDVLMALRPIKTETLTAYTRSGKRIVLREEDGLTEFDSVAVSDYASDPYKDAAPETPAGKTAAVAQFDSIFASGADGGAERDEIPFGYGDISFSAYDSDTGALFGRPDSATILNRAAALRKKLRHVDQSVANTAFGNVIVEVETQQAEVVESIRDNLNVNIKERGVRDANPESVSATNANVDIHEPDASVPDIVENLQQEIEFILAAMPTPLYRVGFTGDVNRDITAEQSEDYRDQVKRERRRLEDDFRRMLTLKARDLMFGNPHTEERLDVDVALRIRPSTSESPLRDEEFSASEFAEFMSGLSTAAGPKGGATAILPKETIVETVLDMDMAEIEPDEPGDQMADLPVQNEAVQAAFDDFQNQTQSEDAQLATRYSEGDVVSTPDSGVGVIAGVITEDKPLPDDADTDLDPISASEESPSYVIVTEEQTDELVVLKASDLKSDEIETDIDALDATKETAAMAELAPDDSEYAELDFTMPESWRDSPKPARVIALDAFSSMGGSFDGCKRTMRGSVDDPDELCASFLDEFLPPYWRGDSPLPGD